MIPRTFKCEICGAMNCWKHIKGPEYKVQCAKCGYACHLWECQLFTGRSDRNDFEDVTDQSRRIMDSLRLKYLASL